MKQYKELLEDVLTQGIKRSDRTGTGTIGIFGHQKKFDLSQGFPLLTTKKLHTRSIFHELLWFLRGETNVKPLQENNVTIWDEWAKEDGDLGRVYGAQWRNWLGVEPNTEEIVAVDQITGIINQLKNSPDSRRIIVTAWNPAEVNSVQLPWCHCLFQFASFPMPDGSRRLDLQLYQRSCDLFLGVPFNIASYALLLMMVAQVVNMTPGIFTHTFGDLHLYLNHLDQAKLQLSRECRALPTVLLNPMVKDIDKFKYDDIHVVNYAPHPPIKAEVSV